MNRAWVKYRNLTDCILLLHITWEIHLSHLMNKTNKMTVRPAKTQISLGICPVWSESSLSTWQHLGFLATHWAHSSDQTGLMLRLIWVFAGCTCHFVGFVMRRLILNFKIQGMTHHPKSSPNVRCIAGPVNCIRSLGTSFKANSFSNLHSIFFF